MSKVIIFGLEELASLAHFYLKNDSEHEVVAFTVHDKFIINNKFEGLPVIPFDNIEILYDPKEFKLLALMTGKKMNKLRESIYIEGKNKGYNFINYISSKTTYYETPVGENSFIFEDNTIQPYTEIGNNVVMWSGNHFGHHGIINDNVFVTSHVVISGRCNIGQYSFLGVNSTLRDGVVLKEGTFVAMSACIIKNTIPWTIYKGIPAKEGGSSLDAI